MEKVVLEIISTGVASVCKMSNVQNVISFKHSAIFYMTSKHPEFASQPESKCLVVSRHTQSGCGESSFGLRYVATDTTFAVNT